jgi:transcriptional regulator with XRE-family HTH domain
MERDPKDKAEVARVLEAIKTILSILDVSNREVERRLGLHPSSLTRFFNGQVEAKLEQVLGIARVVGLDYEELINFLYPGRMEPRAESETARRIRSRLLSLQSSGPRPAAEPPQGLAKEAQTPPGMSAEDLDKVVRAVVQEMRRPAKASKAKSGKG